MSKYRWNRPVLSAGDLKAEINLAKHESLKYQLDCPECFTQAEVLANISIGMSMIMDELEEIKEENENRYPGY